MRDRISRSYRNSWREWRRVCRSCTNSETTAWRTLRCATKTSSTRRTVRPIRVSSYWVRTNKGGHTGSCWTKETSCLWVRQRSSGTTTTTTKSTTSWRSVWTPREWEKRTCMIHWHLTRNPTTSFRMSRREAANNSKGSSNWKNNTTKTISSTNRMQLSTSTRRDMWALTS